VNQFAFTITERLKNLLSHATSVTLEYIPATSGHIPEDLNDLFNRLVDRTGIPVPDFGPILVTAD
jgi:hypothetical protein